MEIANLSKESILPESRAGVSHHGIWEPVATERRDDYHSRSADLLAAPTSISKCRTPKAKLKALARSFLTLTYWTWLFTFIWQKHVLARFAHWHEILGQMHSTFRYNDAIYIDSTHDTVTGVPWALGFTNKAGACRRMQVSTV